MELVKQQEHEAPPQNTMFIPNAPPPIINPPLPNITVNPYQYPVPNWGGMQQPPPNCPPGLEYLTMLNQVLVHQTVELLEVFTGFETANKYMIKNPLGQKLLFAKEESDCCSRNCCGSNRSFEMRIVDNTGLQVIHLKRPLACKSCCFPCCLQKLEVYSPPGTVVGFVQQKWNPLFPSFALKNPTDDDTILRIKGPLCTSSCCFSDVEFDVVSASGNEKVGKISKQWSGLAKEAFTDADNYNITFPVNLDVRMKAVLLGACFLIDMMYFEKKDNNNKLRLNNQDGSPVVEQKCRCCCCCPETSCGSYGAGNGFNCCCC